MQDEDGRFDVHAVFPRAVESVVSARRLVDGLHGHHEARVVAVARLLISEVATNAVKYASGHDIELRITGSETLRFSVTSRSGEHHQPHIAEPTNGGLGLRLVEHLADDWGYQHEDGRTTVWFTLAASRSTPRRSEPPSR
jgi:anti-sigma regulatory factor (Ser/Thr protein kinase)